ncbi:MAG: hypothetical protein NVSMB3_05880 [Acidobacteriaceae bacterium]
MPDIELTPEPQKATWIYRRVVLPTLSLLRLGNSPERLAWSLAVGVAVGINPVLGSTTVACLVVAFLLRLNLAASQITNHLVYPLQLLLFLPFLRLGTRLFGSSSLPLLPAELFRLARTQPFALSRLLWAWEGRALLVWLVVACIGAPLMAASLIPILRRVQARTAEPARP